MEPSEGEMIEELQKTVDELQELLRLKEDRINELEGYTESLERQTETQDAHIKNMDDTIKRQDELISEQQNFTHDNRKGNDEEIGQLQEILEAQETALTEQRSIIEAQAALIEDLQTALHGECDRPQSEGGRPAMQQDLSGANLHIPSYPSGPKRTSGREPSAETTHRELASRTVRSDPSSMSTSRPSPREMLIKRSVVGGNTTPQAPGGGPPSPRGPPRPRPNSAFRKDAPQAPRAKSLGAGAGGSREPDIVRRPGPKQPTTCTAQAGRSSGRRYPPELPRLSAS